MTSGIYIITNTVNEHRYIGSAANLKTRERKHWSSLRRGDHPNRHLQSAWNKYSEASFEFDVLEHWDKEFLVSAEQFWMNMLCPDYNICPVARSSLGVKRTKETRAKISGARMGNQNYVGHKLSDETRAKISAAHIGKTHTDETKAKMSVSHTGDKNHNYSVPMSEEQKAKLSASAMGRKPSAEARANMSAAQKARRSREKKTKQLNNARLGAYFWKSKQKE